MSKYIAPRTKVLYHIDKLNTLRKGIITPPISVEVDLSNRCSLGCEWCHFAYTHTRGPLAGKGDKPAKSIPGGDIMPLDLAKRMLDQLHAYGARSVTWTGGGEPTLHPNFDEIIAYAKIDQGLYTHGGHINQERANLLKEHLTWVYVSLDCADAKTYQKEKGVNRFVHACKGINRLAVADGKATLGAGFLLHQNNYLQASKMAHLGLSLGADYVQFRPAVQYSQESPGMPGENTAWLSHCIEILEDLKHKPRVSVDIERFKMYQNWQGHGYKNCWFSTLSTVITPNGKVWACVNKREHEDALIGDLQHEDFNEIWARHQAHKVNGRCRVMCRGHMCNLTLDNIMTEPKHRNFI